jgi:hypothetical protein
MIKAYYATTNVGPYKEGRVVILDDEHYEQVGLIRTGYFKEIERRGRGSAEGPHRAG